MFVLHNKCPGLPSSSQMLPPKGRLLPKNATKFCSRSLENVLGVTNIQSTRISSRISSKSFPPNSVLVQIHPLPSGELAAKFLGPFSLLGIWGGVQKTKTWMNTLSHGLDFSLGVNDCNTTILVRSLLAWIQKQGRECSLAELRIQLSRETGDRRGAGKVGTGRLTGSVAGRWQPL